MLAVPCENDKNIESHCAVEDNDYCLDEHFPTPRQARHQGPQDLSNFSGLKTNFCEKNIITSVCSICYFNLLCYRELPTVYGSPGFMERQLRDFVEKTKGLVSRFTTSRARIPGI